MYQKYILSSYTGPRGCKNLKPGCSHDVSLGQCGAESGDNTSSASVSVDLRPGQSTWHRTGGNVWDWARGLPPSPKEPQLIGIPVSPKERKGTQALLSVCYLDQLRILLAYLMFLSASKPVAIRWGWSYLSSAELHKEPLMLWGLHVTLYVPEQGAPDVCVCENLYK